jgi:hypothetical protein
MFHRNNNCCDSCCNSCGSTGGVVAPSAEPIAPPKKMPASPAPQKETRIDSGIQNAPVPQAAPTLESAPAVVPSIDADSKSPF